MKKNSVKKVVSSILLAAMTMSMSLSAFATPAITFDEAKNYLLNYSITETDSDGDECTTYYVFDSEDKLNNAANYIVENGLDAFNHVVNETINDVVSKEPKIEARETDPAIAYETVSGDGTHYVSAEAYGYSSFPTLGAIQYIVELSYRATVKGGKFTSVSSASVDFPVIDVSGSYGKISLPSYCNNTSCGVTANYTITKSIDIPLGDGSFTIKSESDKENFALITNLR